jgi:hypothetical protein
MPRPGTQIDIVDDTPVAGAVLDTGQAFFVGSSQKGPVGEAKVLHSLGEFKQWYGERAGGSLLYDALYAYFSEGGAIAIVSRAAGTGSAVATGEQAGSVSFTAASPGTWGNAVVVTLADGTAGKIIATVADASKTLAVSPALDATTPDALVAWANSNYSLRGVVTAQGEGATAPIAGAITLAGGTDGSALDDDSIAAALAAFPYAMGPGQVLAPGLTSTDVHEAVLAHCDATRRVALLDAPDTATAGLFTAVEALYEAEGVRYASLWAPWALYPGEVGPTVLTVPWSPIEAALISINDRSSGNPNDAAAGVAGISRLAIGLSQFITDEDREALNYAGVDLAQIRYGQVRAYGYRTAAGPLEPNWTWFGNARVITSLAHECDAEAEKYVLRQVDGRRVIFAKLEADLRGVCKRYYDLGALFGETPQDAFAVDTGVTINTVDTIKNGEVHAIVRVKCSPTAEWVQIAITKVPIDRAI